MCGVLGAIRRRPGKPFFSRSHLDALVHRGPDGEGLFADEHATLGHRRLAVIDLSEQAGQPMSSADGRYTLTYNGEIYNYIEVRDLLRQKGHSFSTESDTEVLLAAYQQWGTDCLSRLRGMFAFAIWDRRARQLFLARDRCGEKPLTYYLDDEIFVFGSEFKSIAPLLPGLPQLDPAAVDMYLHFGYAPEPFTLLEGVKKLAAGEFAVLSVGDWSMRVERYWDLESIPADATISEQDIRNEIETAVRLTLRSDVPVAVALSGGIDSSLIAALAARHYPEPMHAFSVGYPGRPSYDERGQAEALAKDLGCIFHEVEIPTDQFVSDFPAFVGVMDEPIGDPAAFGHYAVPRIAADHDIKVLLTGIGGDELFWGYDWTRLAVSANSRRRLYDFSAWLLGPFMKSRYARQFMFKASRTRKIPEALRNQIRMTLACCDPVTPPDQLIFMALSGAPEFTNEMNVGHGWYGPRMRDVADTTAFVPTRSEAPANDEGLAVAVQNLLFKTWLVSNCINLGDRVSMAVGVESRLPLLDQRLIELVVARRKAYPDHGQGQKAVLRRVLQDVLPPEVLNRRKSGFVPPVVAWLKGVVDAYGAHLRQGFLVSQGVVRPEAVDSLCRLEQSHASLHTVYRLVLLETWYALMATCADARPQARAETIKAV